MIGGVCAPPPAPARTLADALVAGLARAPEPPPADLTWDGVWFRASGAHDLCPRHVALAAAGKAAWRGAVDADGAWAMARGTGNHVGVQAALGALATPGAVALLGGWAHEDGREAWGAADADRPSVVHPRTAAAVGWIPRPAGDGWAYVECAGEDPSLRLRGHWDGVLRWADGTLELLEIKSWPAARRSAVDPAAGAHPLAKHIEQVHCYMHLAGLDRARIVYVMATDLPDALAEHMVAWDDAVWARVEARIWAARAALRLVADDPTGRTLPDRLPACGSRSDARTRACPGRDACLPKRGVTFI